MADEKKSSKTEADQKSEAVKAYYAAETAAEKRAAVVKYPILKQIFSEANHPE